MFTISSAETCCTGTTSMANASFSVRLDFVALERGMMARVFASAAGGCGATPAGSSAARAAGGGAFCARADAAAIVVASRIVSIRRPFTAPSSVRTSALAARPLVVLLELIELLLHLGGERRGRARHRLR